MVPRPKLSATFVYTPLRVMSLVTTVSVLLPSGTYVKSWVFTGELGLFTGMELLLARTVPATLTGNKFWSKPKY